MTKRAGPGAYAGRPAGGPPAHACVCIFMKPPRPGSVKTRLIPLLGADRAAALAAAFFEDTWAMVQSLPWAVPVVATTDPDAAEPAFRFRALWRQGGGDLGERLEHILMRGIEGFGQCMALGADSPGLSPRILEEARAALQTHDAVLGPCSDGGFYLLGLKRCPAGLLSGIAWSGPETLAQTSARLTAAGMSVALLETYFDVDRPEDLETLRHRLAAGGLRAPRTIRLLRGWSGVPSGQQISERDAGPRPRLSVSVILPVLNEMEQLPGALAELERLDWIHEIIVVDGASTDGTREWLRGRPWLRVVDSARGKGKQLNAGAAGASGDLLLFLHGDCRLPPDTETALQEALSDSSVQGGCFQVSFAETRPRSLRLVAWGINLRTRASHSATGDQGIFVRREAFRSFGGCADWPLFEDVDLVRRIKRTGAFAVLPARLVISGRRHVRDGVLRTVLKIFLLRLGFWVGLSPFVLKRWFKDVRTHPGTRRGTMS